jgi:hypothetical protein
MFRFYREAPIWFHCDIAAGEGGFIEVAVGRLALTLWSPRYWRLAARRWQIEVGPIDLCWWEV